MMVYRCYGLLNPLDWKIRFSEIGFSLNISIRKSEMFEEELLPLLGGGGIYKR